MASYVWSRVLLALALVLALTGCTEKATRPDPVPASCAGQCFSPCTTQGIAWTANPADPGAWYALGDEVIQPLVQRVQTCDAGHRRACHVCLLRLQDEGVITGIPPLPPEPKP